MEAEVEGALRKYHGKIVENIIKVDKEDLKLVPLCHDTKPNHLLGKKKTYLKLLFRNTSDLSNCKRQLIPYIRKNVKQLDEGEAYALDLLSYNTSTAAKKDAKTTSVGRSTWEDWIGFTRERFWQEPDQLATDKPTYS